MKAPAKAETKQTQIALEQLVYTVDTPKWRKYYLRVRKSIRFPRYYKKTVNW